MSVGVLLPPDVSADLLRWLADGPAVWTTTVTLPRLAWPTWADGAEWLAEQRRAVVGRLPWYRRPS